MCQRMDLINAIDEAISTIQHLAKLGPLIDGNPEYFLHAIEILSLIAQQAGHLEKFSSQVARCVLPRLCVVEGKGDA
jgi:hypothetical protein